MTRKDEISDLALGMAHRSFEESVGSLVEAVNGNSDLLEGAAEIVGKAGDGRGPEHIAFTYLSAAYRRVTST